MSPEGKRAVIGAGRRVVFAGLILLGAWLLLMALRGAIPPGAIEFLAERLDISAEAANEMVYQSDWSTSWWTNEPVFETINQRLGLTARILGSVGLLSLAIAALFLFLGEFITRLTSRPGRLTRIRQIIRMVLVSGGVTIPFFLLGTLFIVYGSFWQGWMTSENSAALFFWPVFYSSLVPTWLLVQAGHGELANWPEELKSSYGLLARHLGVKLIIRLLRLTGAVLVITIFVGGLGSLVTRGAMMRDFPVLFGAAWVLVIIVVPARLAAELIEIAYNHFANPLTSNSDAEEPARTITIPRGWLFFSLALVVISLAVAWIGPLLAPYGVNEINLNDRLAGPSSAHILGADNLGRDIFTRLLYGLRNTLSVGLMAVGIIAVAAAGWAVLAAWFRKRDDWLGDTLEDLVMLPVDVLSAFPWLVAGLILVSMFTVDPGLFQLTLVIGLGILLPRAINMMRETYRSAPAGRGWLDIVLRSIPVMLLFAVAAVILYTSSLSFRGFGLPPPTPELGGMLSGTGRTYMLGAPWMVLWPFIWLLLLSLVWVMAGNTLLERLGFGSRAVWSKSME